MENPAISPEMLEGIMSKAFLVIFAIITVVFSAALGFLAIKKLKNPFIFYTAALGCALPCYGALMILTSDNGTGGEIAASGETLSIPLFILGGLGILDFCKEKGLMHKILQFVMIGVAIWHLGYSYGGLKAKDNHQRNQLIADWWVTAVLVGYACFLLVKAVRLMTKITLGVYLCLLFVYAILWSIYKAKTPPTPDDEKFIAHVAVIMNTFIPASLAAILFMYARENPDDSETLL